MDDIPQAARDQPLPSAGVGQPPWVQRTRLLWRVLGLGLLALVSGGIVAWSHATWMASTEFARPFETMVSRPAAEGTAADRATAAFDRASQLAPSSRGLLLGHRAFDEAPEEELVPLSANRSIRLRSVAAAQYEDMASAAARDGIRLVPLSGFRSQAEQEKIFFGLKAQRGQDAHTRAEVSAPPGYSEHHTGYAIDIGDASQAGTHLSQDFADTRAYQWMAANAARYGFELSFPTDNFQGVAFEPWHWRFVGDRHSLETFYSE